MSEQTLAFVTNAGDGTVSTFQVGPENSLTRVAVSPVGSGCSTLVVDPARRQVHVAVKEPAAIVTTAIQNDGSLTPVSRREVPDSLHYLALSPDGGEVMIAASYGGGFGITLPVVEDGVGEPVSRVDHPNVHSCAFSPDGRFAYFVSLGADLVAQCAVSGTALRPLEPATAAAPAGSGPRHLAINAAGDHVYVITEFSGEVLHYERDVESGTLQLRDKVAAFDPSKGLKHSRFGADPRTEHLIWGADLHFSAGEQVLWASERSGSTLATIPVGADGSLGEATQFAPTETQPRGFGVSPDGTLVLCTGERSTHVSLFTSDPGTRELTRVAREETGNGANWVRFMTV